MNFDYGILICVWACSFLLLFLIPKDRRRIALVAFLFKQMITILLGLVAVELGLLAYPVRELADVNRTSLTYELLAYPMVCAVFNAHYPNTRSPWIRIGYLLGYCTLLTIPELLLERFTRLVEYVHWNWWWTWLSLLVTFVLTRSFVILFFRQPEKAPGP